MTGFDSALDALFKSSAGALPPKPIPKPTAVPIPIPVVPPNLQASTSAPTKRKHEKTDQSETKRRKTNRSEQRLKAKEEDSSEEDDPAVEDAYHQRKSKATQSKVEKSSQIESKVLVEESDSDSGSNSDTDVDDSPPLHESLTQKPEAGRPRKKKYIPEGETPEQKDARTIFIGNLPASVAKSSARKSLQKHVLNCLSVSYPDLPRPKIESSRFRSVAFNTPTTKLPSDALSSKPKRETPLSEHNRTRAAEWRATQDPEGTTLKTFQTPAQKKKTAYITGALHDSAKSSASAYVVFAYPDPVEGSEPAWDPAEVAARAVLACDGSTFMDRVLRVDRVGKREEDKPDPRTMIFVGNLDFEVDENAVRELFERLVEKERGESEAQKVSSDSESEDGEDEDESEQEDEAGEESADGEGNEAGEAEESSPTKATPAPLNSAAKAWVKNVRIIRDKDTQLGKGFGYVQFIDRASADEILAMEPGTIKLAKRKLRIQRCKTVPGVSLQKPKVSRPANDSKKSDPPSKSDRQKPKANKPARVLRADPGLGERIRSLSKEDRKSVKAGDADRIARRLAKKKAKVVSERGARKEASRSKANILGGPKPNKSKHGKSGKRERSDKALLKKNVKK